jgi:hypothetical protein
MLNTGSPSLASERFGFTLICFTMPKSMKIPRIPETTHGHWKHFYNLSAVQ